MATQWRRSTRSGSTGGNCVEIALSDAVAVRDSKKPDGPVLIFTRKAWAAFLADLRAR